MIERKVKFKGKDYLVKVSPDIAVRGGERGKGTTTYVYTDKGLKGFQGSYSKRKVLELLKENPSKVSGDSPAVYVGTYGKYNAGSLKGAWLNLEDYDSKEEFMKAAHELHKDEDDPELMFQDYQNFPDEFYGESYLPEKLWEWLKLSEDERKVYAAYVELVGEKYATFQSAQDAFMGVYDDEGSWAADFIKQLGGISALGDSAYGYFKMSPTDQRVLVSDLASSYVGDLDERDLRREAKERGIEGSSHRKIDDLREEVESDYAEDLEKELRRSPVDYMVDELGYDLDSLEKVMSFDYDAYARDAEMNGDVSFVEVDHQTYAFYPR